MNEAIYNRDEVESIIDELDTLTRMLDKVNNALIDLMRRVENMQWKAEDYVDSD